MSRRCTPCTRNRRLATSQFVSITWKLTSRKPGGQLEPSLIQVWPLLVPHCLKMVLTSRCQYGRAKRKEKHTCRIPTTRTLTLLNNVSEPAPKCGTDNSQALLSNSEHDEVKVGIEFDEPKVDEIETAGLH